MSLLKVSTLIAAGAMLATFAVGAIAQDMAVDPAIATMSADQVVAARKAAMKENGGTLKAAGALTGAEASAAADILIKNFTNFPAMFPEGSIVGDSKALPVIWENKADFDGIFAKDLENAKAMKAAAEAGDADAYGAALKAIGGSCGECHQKYRS
ncbi:c-type cytochrome [Devosia sp.]|jgi:cytochrome c556|uniref:c-type cytochrome n=1 Tax=Devosia sp. TaxID=1871048 RepID=UPI0037BEC859